MKKVKSKPKQKKQKEESEEEDNDDDDDEDEYIPPKPPKLVRQKAVEPSYQKMNPIMMAQHLGF